MTVFLLTTVGTIEAREPASPTSTALDVDWQASRSLVFYALPAARIVAGENEVQVRIVDGEELWFFERLTFDSSAMDELSQVSAEKLDRAVPPEAVPAVHGVELLSRQPAGLTQLLDLVRSGRDFAVEILLNGDLLFDGRMRQLVEASDVLRDSGFLPIQSTSIVADLRGGTRGAGRLSLKSSCEGACSQAHADCLEEFCGNGDDDMCLTGCDDDLDSCLVACAQPVVCTARVIASSTTTQIVTAQFLGYDCFDSFYGPFEEFQRYYTTFKRTTTETHQRTDCSTFQVVTVSYFSRVCHHFAGFCPFPYSGFGVPVCVI